jgi:hypothetical protein
VRRGRSIPLTAGRSQDLGGLCTKLADDADRNSLAVANLEGVRLVVVKATDEVGAVVVGIDHPVRDVVHVAALHLVLDRIVDVESLDLDGGGLRVGRVILNAPYLQFNVRFANGDEAGDLLVALADPTGDRSDGVMCEFSTGPIEEETGELTATRAGTGSGPWCGNDGWNM